MLNAFWRRGDVDGGLARHRPLSFRCSTPFGDGAMWTGRVSGRLFWCFRVLNAFWRRGDVDPTLNFERQCSCLCSTPFGDGAMWTWRRLAHAQARGYVLNAFWRRGDVDRCWWRPLRGLVVVLNAFWRRGDVDNFHFQRIARRLKCSTPFGDGAMWTWNCRGF